MSWRHRSPPACSTPSAALLSRSCCPSLPGGSHDAGARPGPQRSPQRRTGRARCAGGVTGAPPSTGQASAPLRRRHRAGCREIVGLLSDNPAGLRAEQIRQKLGLQAKELPRPLKEGLEGGRLSKVGRKRATTYFAGAGSSGASKRRKPAAGAPRAGRGRARAAKAGGAQAKKRRRSKGSKGKAAKG